MSGDEQDQPYRPWSWRPRIQKLKADGKLTAEIWDETQSQIFTHGDQNELDLFQQLYARPVEIEENKPDPPTKIPKKQPSSLPSLSIKMTTGKSSTTSNSKPKRPHFGAKGKKKRENPTVVPPKKIARTSEWAERDRTWSPPKGDQGGVNAETTTAQTLHKASRKYKAIIASASYKAELKEKMQSDTVGQDTRTLDLLDVSKNRFPESTSAKPGYVRTLQRPVQDVFWTMRSGTFNVAVFRDATGVHLGVGGSKKPLRLPALGIFRAFNDSAAGNQRFGPGNLLMENSDGIAKLLPGMSISHPLKTLVPLDQTRYELPPGLSLDASPLLYVQAAVLGPCEKRDLKFLGLPDVLNLKNVALSGLEADKLADLFSPLVGAEAAPHGPLHQIMDRLRIWDNERLYSRTEQTMLEVLMARHDEAHHNHFQAAMNLLKENPEKDALVPYMELSSELCPLVYGSPIIMRPEDGLVENGSLLIWTSPMLHFGHVNRIEYDLAQCFFEAGEEAPVNGKAAKDLASALKKIEAIVEDFGTKIKVSIAADASVGPSWMCVTPSFHALCSEAFLRLGECEAYDPPLDKGLWVRPDEAVEGIRAVRSRAEKAVPVPKHRPRRRFTKAKG